MRKQIIKKTRIEWVDWLKALAIIFVVIGHFPINAKLKLYLYAFHLPLFFVLSGITFNVEKYKNIKEFVKHKAKGILLPYLCLNFSYFAFWAIFNKALVHTDITLVTLLKGLIFANADKAYILNGPTWFLPTLFLVELCGYVAIKFFKDDERQLMLFSCFSLLLGYAESLRVPRTRMIWNLNGIPVSLFIFMAGYLFAKFYNKDKSVKKVVDGAKFYYGILFVAIGVYIALKNGRVSFGGDVYRSIIYTIISIAFNIAGYFILITKICKLKFIGNIMSYIGKNTLFILGFHKAVLIILKYFNVKLINNEWGAIVLALVAVALTGVTSLFVNKVCPFVVGKLEKTKRNIVSFAVYTAISIFILIKYCL